MKRFLRPTNEGHGPKAQFIDPLSLANLQLYMRSDQATGTNGNPVVTWPDLSSHARNGFFPFARPVLRTTGLNTSVNGTQTVEWAAAGQTMECLFPATAIPATNGWTFFCYYKQITQVSVNQFLFADTVGNGVEAVVTADPGFWGGTYQIGHYGFNSGGRKGFNELSTLGWHTFALVLTPPASGVGTAQAFVDDVPLTPTYTNWNTALEDDFWIGNSAAANARLEGAMGALMVYSQAYSASTLAGLRRFIRRFFEQ